MKMILAIVTADDASTVTSALTASGHRVTRIATEGGWLRRQSTTLLLGVEDDRVNDALQLIKTNARQRTTEIYVPAEGVGALPFKVETGGAIMFVLQIEQMTSV